MGRVLGLPQLVWVGGLSYSLYLWHWPFLVAADGLWDDLRVRHTLLVVLVSAVPAWLSYRYVENPLRSHPRLAPPRRALLLGAAGTLTAALAGLAVVASLSLVATTDVASAEEAPGAPALTDPQFSGIDWTTVEKVEAIRPSPLHPDTPSIYDTRECMPNYQEDRRAACEFGDTDSEHTVVLVGDSKAAQWFTAVESIATRAGWRMLFIGKDGCQFADVVRPLKDPSPSCEKWSQWALHRVLAERPDVVLTVTRYSTARRPGQPESAELTQRAMVDGLVSHWRAVLDNGAMIVPILDTPGRPGGRVPECVLRHSENLTTCRYPLADQLDQTGQPAQRAAAVLVPRARVVDMTDLVCPGGVFCPPVIGNVLVYRSGSHLSDSFATSATDTLAARIAEATGGLLDAR